MDAFTVNDANNIKKRFYKKSTFVTHLPVVYRYSPSHSWAMETEAGRWRVGLTKFATRMLGEMVDYGFESKAADPIEPGQIIGWLEGFKAISDLYTLIDGTLEGVNPALEEDITLISKDPYGKGWLYEASGTLDERCMPVDDYVKLLDTTIEKILEQQRQEAEE